MDKDRMVLTPESGVGEIGDASPAQIEDHSLPAEEVLRQQRREQCEVDPAQVFIP